MTSATDPIPLLFLTQEVFGSVSIHFCLSDHLLKCRFWLASVLSQVPRKFTSKVEGKMGYEDFVYFILSEEDKSSEPSLEYWYLFLIHYPFHLLVSFLKGVTRLVAQGWCFVKLCTCKVCFILLVNLFICYRKSGMLCT